MKEIPNLTTSANFDSTAIKKLVLASILIVLLIPAIFYLSSPQRPGVAVGLSEIGIWRSFFKPKVEDSSIKIDNAQSEESSPFAESLKPIHAAPKKLYADSVNISANIIEVGVTPEGAMETPQVWTEAGWYNRSSRPGEIGNMIVNAHFDNNFGQPAAFWELKNLKVGDKVYLVDDFGKTYTYQVTELLYIDISDPNRLKILESDNSKAHITLITCGGVWLPGYSTYNKRVVVKGDLVK